MKHFIITFAVLAGSVQLSAQSDGDISKLRITFPEPVQEKDTLKNVKTPTTPAPVQVDFKLSINKQVEYIIDTITRANKYITKAKGYRIAMYNGPDKEELRKVKEFVYSLYPDINIISEYKQPNYRIKVGDFLTRFEAFEAIGKISATYPEALIVPEVVDINPPKTNE